MPETVSQASAPDGSIAIVEGDPLSGDFVLVCEHASKFIPAEFSNLGLKDADLGAHIAWDIGAAELARGISSRLGCGLVRAGVSRLVIDLNRHKSAEGLIPRIGENTTIPGNCGLDPQDREARIATFHAPFHQRLDRLLEHRRAARRLTHLISVHSFTPTFKDRQRPWHAGIIHGDRPDFARRLLAELGCAPDLVIGENIPYTPADGVYHTLAEHGDANGLPTAMIEVRNDLLGTSAEIDVWAERLAKTIVAAGQSADAPGQNTGVRCATV